SSTNHGPASITPTIIQRKSCFDVTLIQVWSRGGSDCLIERRVDRCGGKLGGSCVKTGRCIRTTVTAEWFGRPCFTTSRNRLVGCSDGKSSTCRCDLSDGSAPSGFSGDAHTPFLTNWVCWCTPRGFLAMCL